VVLDVLTAYFVSVTLENSSDLRPKNLCLIQQVVERVTLLLTHLVQNDRYTAATATCVPSCCL
jgi:hypothetical protein